MLDEIVLTKQQEVEEAKSRLPFEELKDLLGRWIKRVEVV